MKHETKQWMMQADEDMSAAQANFAAKKYYVSVFLCQQAVEKALKAMLLETSGTFPKVHDLVLLGKKCSLPLLLLEKCERLTQLYIETRYVDLAGKLPYLKFNKENTPQFIALAKEMLQWLKKKLSAAVPVKKLILFGSRASGTPKRWSDFDIMIVSNQFKGIESYERPLGFHSYWDADYPVDFLCYTPEEFNKLKRQITIVREAVENGIEI